VVLHLRLGHRGPLDQPLAPPISERSRITEHHQCTGRSERSGGLEADPSGGTGNYGHVLVQLNSG